MTAAERSFRYAVIPLSLIFQFLGIFMLVNLWLFAVPITSPMPFVRSEQANRLVFSFISIYCIGVGIGLLRRRRSAWIGLMMYIIAGVAIPVAGLLDSQWVDRLGNEAVIACILVNGAIGLAIGFVIHPAFAKVRPLLGIKTGDAK